MRSVVHEPRRSRSPAVAAEPHRLGSRRIQFPWGVSVPAFNGCHGIGPRRQRTHVDRFVSGYFGIPTHGSGTGVNSHFSRCCYSRRRTTMTIVIAFRDKRDDSTALTRRCEDALQSERATVNRSILLGEQSKILLHRMDAMLKHQKKRRRRRKNRRR
jgi:hypothetical protein